MAVFEEHGIRFEYPDGWEISHEHHEEDFSVTVESEGTAFWMLSVLAGRPPAEEVIDAALGSFEAEYDSVDVSENAERICMLPTVAVDVDFYELEMVNHASLRACETDNTTIFVLLQMSDTEREATWPLLKAISDSLMWDSGDDDELDGELDPFAFDNLFGGMDHVIDVTAESKNEDSARIEDSNSSEEEG